MGRYYFVRENLKSNAYPFDLEKHDREEKLKYLDYLKEEREKFRCTDCPFIADGCTELNCFEGFIESKKEELNVH